MRLLARRAGRSAPIEGGPPDLFRGTLLNFADTAISLASALIVSVVLARALGPQKFGIYSLVMTVTTFTYVVARFGIGETVSRYVAELEGSGDRALAAAVGWRGLRLGVLTSCAAAAALVLVAGPLAAFFQHGELRLYFVLGGAGLVPLIAGTIFGSVLRGLQQYQYLVLMNIVTSPLWVVASTLVVLKGGGVAGLLIVGLVIETVNLVILGWCSYREIGPPRGHSRVPSSLGSRLVRYNLAVAALLLINMIVWQRSELIFLGRFQGPQQVAYYALPFSLTERMTELAPGALLSVVLPGLAQAYGAADPERFTSLFSEAVRWLTIMTLPICLFGIPLAAAALTLLYGPAYAPAAPVLQVLLVAVLFGVFGQVASSALLGLESQGWLLKTGVVAVVASLLLDFALIPRWGALGAAVANTVTQVGWAIAAFAPLWRRVRPDVRAAAARTAATAMGVSLLLTLVAVVRPPLPALVLAGVLGTAIYLIALERMQLFSARLLLARLRPQSKLLEEVSS